MEIVIVAAVLAVLLVIVVAGFVRVRRRPPAPEKPVEGAGGRESTAVLPPQPVEAPEEAQPSAPAPPPVAVSPAERFRDRLTRARNGLGARVAAIFGQGIDEAAWEELEDSLIAADVGIEATMELVAGLRERCRSEGIGSGAEAMALLQEVLRLELGIADRSLKRRADGTTVWLITGVNGTGKTTSIGKMAAAERAAGRTAVLAAADTFRAAAVEQLERWGERAGARVVRQAAGADPAAVAFDGLRAAEAAGADVLMVDTAGRLQNKRALMDELGKVKRVLDREAGQCDETLLVLDATTGQNGLAQARAFLDAVDVTGVILTKLDGTAKGGIVIAIQRQLGIPVKLVGLGEGLEDLTPFDPDAFVDALFAEVTQEVEIEDAPRRPLNDAPQRNQAPRRPSNDAPQRNQAPRRPSNEEER